MIKSHVIKNSGTADEAIDIFQEALEVFYRNVMSGDFQLQGKISSYLYGVSRRLWLNQLNRYKKREKPSDDAILFERVHEEREEQNPIALEKYVRNLLEKLGEPCKSLLEAVFFRF